jgi:hypothetical protein
VYVFLFPFGYMSCHVIYSEIFLIISEGKNTALMRLRAGERFSVCVCVDDKDDRS